MKKYNPSDEFVSPEESERIIKLGYDYPFLNDRILYSQAFNWFREKYNLFVEFEVDQTMEPKFCFRIYWYRLDYRGNEWFDLTNTVEHEWYLYYTYKEAEEDCVKYLIDIAEEHNELGVKLFF